MLGVGLKAVRYYKALFFGAFLTMSLGVALIGVAATALAACLSVPSTTTGPQVVLGAHVYYRDAVDMQGITTVLALAAVVCGFIMVTNVAGTFAFSVALRRRDLGLMRLLGMDGGQVRRLVLVEALAVAVPSAAVGCLIAVLVAPPTLDALNHTDLTPIQLSDHNSFGALAVAYVVGVLLALLAALLASVRAAKVSPAEALRDAVIDRNVMTRGRWVVGLLTLTAGVVMLASSPAAGALNSTALAIFGTFALTIASTSLGPVYLPVLIRVVGAPAHWLGATAGGLAVASMSKARRNATSLAAPVLSIMAVTGIMVGVLLTTDATGLADQVARTNAQLVAESTNGTGISSDTLRRITSTPGVRAVSAPAPLKVAFATPDQTSGSAQGHGPGQPITHGGSGMVDAAVMDLDSLAAVQQVHVVEGRLGTLTGNQIAVRKEFISWYSVHAGSTLRIGLFDGRVVDATVAVIVDGGTSLPQIMVSPQLAAAKAGSPKHANILLTAGTDPGAAAARLAAIAGSGVRFTPVAQWYAASGAAEHRLQNLVLLVLVGPASLFALIAVANTMVMAFSRRGREIAGMTLLGVTSGQIRLMATVEALLVTCLAAGVAAVYVIIGLVGYRTALGGSYLATSISMPWSLMAGLAAACVVVAVLTGLLAAGRQLRRPAIGMITARE
jgi:putative ABC transport system permease protein